MSNTFADSEVEDTEPTEAEIDPTKPHRNADGLIVRETGFGDEVVVGFDEDEWEAVYENPQKIDWDKENPIDVTLEKREEIEIADEETGEKKPLTLLLFRETKSRELRSTVEDYQLTEAGLTVGRRYLIERTDRVDLGKGRKLNQYKVLGKK